MELYDARRKWKAERRRAADGKRGVLPGALQDVLPGGLKVPSPHIFARASKAGPKSPSEML